MRLLRPYPAGEMGCYPVSTAVNDPHHEGAGLIGRVREASA